MKNITISKIDQTNPVLSSYISKIKSWDKDGILGINKDNNIEPFYALYYSATFFGAGVIKLDKEKSMAMVSMINAHMDIYNKFKEETEKKLEELISNEYGINKIEFSYTKKRG